MSVYSNVLELIGNTPMVALSQLDTGPCALFGKLESDNPGGSIKDRIALTMIEGAERDGRIKPGDTLVEATAGNTGLALALVAAQKGYRLLIVMPDKMSQEKVFNLKAMGAEVVMARSDVQKGHPEYYQEVAARIAKEQGAYFVNQFANPDNVRAHEEGTAPEIWEQMEGRLDAVVCGVGSGGTVAGFSRFFKRVAPHVEVVLADPEGSIVAEYIRDGKYDEAGSWVIEGIGEDFIPDICEFDQVKKAYTIPDSESLHTARELLRKEGLLAGSSTGTLLAAALRYCREQTEPKRVVTLLCDTGNKYLSKMYNDFWMMDRGFIDRERVGDLRDFVARPHAGRVTVCIGIGEPLSTAHLRMRENGLSQLPVLDGERFAGLVDERSLLTTLAGGVPPGDPVEKAMRTDYATIDASDEESRLAALLEAEHAVVMKQGDAFVGLVTRGDYITALGRRA